MSNEIEDDALMVLFANGDGDAAQILTRRHAPKVFSLAFRLTQNRVEAEDITQEAMLRLWRSASDWRQGQAKLSTWLYRVTSNLVIDAKRKRKEVPGGDDLEVTDPSLSVENTLIEQDRAGALREAIATLPQRQQIAITLRHLEELSNPEIALIMSLSVEAVESLLARGKKRLSEILSRQKDKIGLRA